MEARGFGLLLRVYVDLERIGSNERFWLQALHDEGPSGTTMTIRAAFVDKKTALLKFQNEAPNNTELQREN